MLSALQIKYIIVIIIIIISSSSIIALFLSANPCLDFKTSQTTLVGAAGFPF